MKITKIRVAIGLAVATLAALPLYHSASAQTTQIKEEFVDPARFHPCTHENVALQGRIHVTTTTTANPDGTFHLKFHVNTQGVEGIGTPSGDMYRFNNGENLTFQTDVQGGMRTHTVGHTEYIHVGESLGFPDPNDDDFHEHFNITVLPSLTAPPATEIFQAAQQDPCR
ncbi:MAG: hypothetical protein M3280_07900 [Actinomycetota bacterium]|nr:hypothetical protein [Actinomycetota bacterium]